MISKQLFHSPTKIAFLGKSLQIAICALSDLSVSDDALKLNATLADVSIELPMANKGSIELNGKVYNIFSSIIPSTFIKETGTLSYSISFEGENIISCRCNAVAIPNIPELYISEMSARPKGTTCSAFLELTNTTSEPIDLYNYQVAIYGGFDPLAPQNLVINPLCETEGECLLPPKSTAAVVFNTPKQKIPIREQYLSQEGFCNACNEDYRYCVGYEPISPEKINVVFPEICTLLPNGEYRLKPRCDRLPIRMIPYTVSVLKKDSALENSVCSVYLNEVPMEYDIRVNHSALWGIDLSNPTKMKNIRRHVAPTPGYLDVSQAIPDFTDILPPVIIPDTDTTHIYHKDGALTLTYAVDK